ncbi:MAG: flavodoxin [Elusimicrobiota bacterium]|jgi:flavodoxin|nr:flavodoxin [Elusimicrobiota bacterium]
MIKIFSVVLIAVSVLCGFYFVHKNDLRNKNEMEMEKYKKADITFNKNIGKALVVYYSFSGNTEKIARIIQKNISADTLKIEMLQPYKSTTQAYFSFIDIKTKKFPALKNQQSDFSNYDIIFVGSPVWFYTLAPPLFSFLNSANFNGKKVVPFATHMGNVGHFFKDFKENAKNAKILKEEAFFSVSKEAENALENKVADWLNKLYES